jgi:hypothetical protein
VHCLIMREDRFQRFRDRTYGIAERGIGLTALVASAMPLLPSSARSRFLDFRSRQE